MLSRPINQTNQKINQFCFKMCLAFFLECCASSVEILRVAFSPANLDIVAYPSLFCIFLSWVSFLLFNLVTAFFERLKGSLSVVFPNVFKFTLPICYSSPLLVDIRVFPMDFQFSGTVILPPSASEKSNSTAFRHSYWF